VVMSSLSGSTASDTRSVSLVILLRDIEKHVSIFTPPRQNSGVGFGHEHYRNPGNREVSVLFRGRVFGHEFWGRFLVCRRTAEGRVFNHPDRRTGRKTRQLCCLPIIHCPCYASGNARLHCLTSPNHPRILLKTHFLQESGSESVIPVTRIAGSRLNAIVGSRKAVTLPAMRVKDDIDNLKRVAVSSAAASKQGLCSY